MVVMRGNTERNEEDVAKLVYLYVCAKLFFAHTGESICWAYVRVIDKLDTLHLYDWIGMIRSTLISSLNELHNRPKNVTGCVIALLFLIYEHTNIVEPDRHNVFPTFCRWNIGKLVGKLKGVDLLVDGSMEVNCGKICGTIIERYFVEVTPNGHVPIKRDEKVLDVDPVNVWDGQRGVMDREDMNVVELSFNCWQPDSPNGGEVEMSLDNNNETMPKAQPYSNVKDCGKMLSSGESWPVLFLDLLDLSSTQHGITGGNNPEDTTE
ncbi:uncharacterized protein LOC114297598 [Camellia sinensis]|uniref:uncharacterized protein LOC114297598 n=1 Tax=Camellia sinensis TaxID=4442 RepID=UPI001036F283|nr:uncharacterized protein LOC114297598 [Camellia sinensis]